MIKSYIQFIKEFIASESFIDAKMQEIKDLIDNISDKTIIYEWQNNNDHQLNVSFSNDALSVKYEFDIDELFLTKTSNNVIDFETEVESVDSGLEMIEKDVQSILGVSEELRFQKSERRFEELKNNLSVRRFIQKFNKIRKQKLKNVDLEVKPTWSEVDVFFSDVENSDRDYFLSFRDIPKEKQKSGMICVNYNDVICFFKPEIQGDTIVYTYDSHKVTKYNPALTSEGKSLVQDFIDLCASTRFVLDRIEVPTRFTVTESIRGDWSSSISEEQAEDVVDRIMKFSQVEAMDGADSEGLVKDLEESLSNYDNETIDLVVDTILFCSPEDNSWKEWVVEEIIKVGDKIMSKYGTEPGQVLNAYETAFNFLRRNFDWEEELSEAKKGRPRSQRYKGRKIPGKYLGGPHPSKMKKEIETFRGKDQYKKDWDADYTTGKGGKGKRVKTKKSAATKAYQKMFGK